jgi:uncharacterized protein (TIGR02147 family)
VYDYLDYRAFLGDVYRAKKEQSRGFSYRSFSRRAGLRSPNHLKRVIDGERNLTADMAPRYAEAIGLSADETAYFSDLVSFNQASGSTARNRAYQKLTGHRGYRKAQRLELAHAAYHAEWYVPAIREMARRPDFRAEASWLAERMMPTITTAEAGRALDVLFELHLLERRADGTVHLTEEIVSTGSQTAGLHIGNYHRTMLARAAASIDLVPAPERDISSLTFCVAEDGLRRLKERVQRFRRELVALATQEDEGDRVVQVGLQVFPLTTSRSTEGTNPEGTA